MALGHLVVLVPHDGRAVDVGGDLPAEGLVQQIVLGRGGQVLAAPDHMGDAHEVIVHHVGEVVGGQAVPLQQHLIVQSLVLHGDVTEGHIMEGGGALVGDCLLYTSTNCPVASTLLAVELFGAEGMLYFALACCCLLYTSRCV